MLDAVDDEPRESDGKRGMARVESDLRVQGGPGASTPLITGRHWLAEARSASIRCNTGGCES